MPPLLVAIVGLVLIGFATAIADAFRTWRKLDEARGRRRR